MACGATGLCVLAARRGDRSGRRAGRGARPRQRGARDAENVVRRRHPRVPAQGRPDRRRQRLDRRRPEDQADPHDRPRDRPGRTGPHPRRARSSGCAATPASCTNRAPTPGSSSTSRTRRRPTTLAADCREIFGCEPAFISEIGPVIGAHVGPGLIGLGAVSWSILDAG